MELFYLAIKVAIGSAIGTSIGLWLVLNDLKKGKH